MPDRIWIVGGSDGIGAALARAYAARGAEVIVSARSSGPLRNIADEIRGTAIPCDVTAPNSLAAAAEKIAKSGPLDRAITLAAIYDPGKVMEVEPHNAAQIVTVNLTGTFNFIRAAQPLLRKGAQLVLTGSVAGYIGLPQGQIYSATKAGVANLAETLRAEMAHQTDVRLLSPGFVDTRMTRENDFNMPFIIEPEAAANAIIKGLNGHRFETHFPKRLTMTLKLLRALPYWAAFSLTQRLVR